MTRRILAEIVAWLDIPALLILGRLLPLPRVVAAYLETS